MGCCSSSENHDKLETFVSANSLSLCILTWNVNAKKPSDTFGKLLNHDNIPFDFYVIGLQEIVDLNAKNLIKDNDRNIIWENKIENVLNNPHYGRRKSLSRRSIAKPKYKYVKLRSIGLVGILLMIYVKDSILHEISDIMSSKCASGLFDIAGNKGGVGIRFNIFDTSICFVNCHLAAHKNNIKGRNEDYHKIIQKLSFIPDDKDGSPSLIELDSKSKSAENVGPTEPSTSPSLTLKATNSNASNADGALVMASMNINNESLSMKRGNRKQRKASSMNGLSILQHDIVYFCGDLNYRLEYDDDDRGMVLDVINSKDWQQLLLKDQLLSQIENGYAFADFHEQKIQFQPTFKFEPGTNQYEETKKRMPSYCDRILWKIKKSNDKNGIYSSDEIKEDQEDDGDGALKRKVVNCIKYNCRVDEKMSDHKPVYGLFEIQY